MPAPALEQPGQPRELPPGEWEPPPVRCGPDSQEQEPQSAEETPESETPRPLISKRRAWLAIGVMATAVCLVFGIAIVSALKIFHKSEETLAREASDFYKSNSFGEARRKYEELKNKFATSDRAEEYSFMVDWCDVSSTVSDPDDVADAAGRLDQFIKSHKKNPLMTQLGHDAGQRLLNLVKLFVARNANPKDDSPLKGADRIERLQSTVSSLGKEALTRKEAEQIGTDLGNVRKAVELARKRRHVREQLHARKNETPMEAIKRARALLARMERELPGITQESKEALSQLEEAHLASVVFHPAKDAPAPPPPPSVDNGEVMLFAPLLRSSAPTKAPPNDPVVLALDRGLLYALKQSNGELKWATRVGIDTTVLPQRVPASDISPELLLVLSADTQVLSALSVNGDSLWEYHVGQPVLGRPIIIDHRAYLADYSGWVHEIELSRGQLLGRWSLGQPLTCGGAREEGTSRIYFPADDSCIYVLDVSPRAQRCVTILYDWHPSGSLRSEPVIIPPEGDNAPGYLILNQARGLDAMRLRVFELPLQDRHAPPLDLKSAARFPGWTWFEPKQDGEKLAVLSDAGSLGLFGIRQLGNKDPPLFPLLRAGGLDLSAFLNPAAAPAKRRDLLRERGRSLVVQMRNDDLWVLANGRFQQLQLRLNWTTGPQAVPGWKEPLVLGSPLHEPQLFEDRNSGRSTFFLVTQAQEQQTSLATTVDEDGRILWQRQLGLVCQSEPLALTPPGGGPPHLLALDQGGGLFELDPQQPLDKLRIARKALAPALADNSQVPPRLVRAADGRSAYEIAAPGDGQWLIVRRIVWSDNGRELRYDEHPASLRNPAGNGVLTPIGPPAITRSHLLIPMADGTVKGLSLTDDDFKLQSGPDWSHSQPPVSTPSILALEGDRYLTTNGNRSLSVVEWPPGKGKFWERLPRGGDPHKLEYLVAAPPVLLPSAANQPARVVVADSAGVLRLYTVMPDGSLQAGLITWKLEGNLTAGPFVQAAPEGGWRIGCILERRRLLWIDPAKAEPLWTYSTDGPAIIGQPQPIEDMLVTALQSGHYVGIDPKTGQPKGPGYTLRTSAAPAATPMSFGAGRMFTPLSDGTALLLSVDLLRQKKQ
jgi:hypothetical protein